MNKKIKLWFNGGLIFIILTAVIIYLHFGGSNSMLDLSWIDANIKDQGAVGFLIFLALCASFTSVGIPRQLLSFIAGYAFGVSYGTLFAVLGAALGCALGFFFTRLFIKELIRNRFNKKLTAIDKFISRSPFLMTLTLRCMPMTLNVLTNISGGVSNIKPLTFISASALGYLPQTLIFALLGSGIEVDPVWRTTVSFGLFLASSALGVFLYKRHSKNLNIDNS